MITNALASQVIIDILNKEMAMPANSVWLREQDRTIPNDNKLYIEVGLVGARTISNNVEMLEIANSQYQISSVYQQEAIQIDVLSSKTNNYAMLRNWEVIAALGSFYSQQQQEVNEFKIFRIPRSFIDTSSAEGGSMLQRYTITIMAFVWYRKQTLLDNYYNDFNVRVDDEKTIGTTTPVIKFEITENTPPPFGD